jgi:hypothetical protein
VISSLRLLRLQFLCNCRRSLSCYMRHPSHLPWPVPIIIYGEDTDYEAPHYVIVSSFPFLSPSEVLSSLRHSLIFCNVLVLYGEELLASQLPTRRITTPCRLSVTAYSIQPQLPYIHADRLLLPHPEGQSCRGDKGPTQYGFTCILRTVIFIYAQYHGYNFLYQKRYHDLWTINYHAYNLCDRVAVFLKSVFLQSTK